MRIHKVLLIADPHASHTKRWANLLASSGRDVLVFGLPEYDREGYVDSVKIETLGLSRSFFMQDDSGSKITYLKALPMLRRVIQQFKPDVLHAQYASSSGLLGALTGFHPFFISVWGTDIYDFPKGSLIRRKIIEYNLWKADKILSTSHDMARETMLYTSKQVIVTPFGIDVEKYSPADGRIETGSIVIGTIKRLHKKYGIDNLIRVFSELVKTVPEKDLRLAIAGSGEEEQSLRDLVSELGMTERVTFHGFLPIHSVPEFLRSIDIAVFLSHKESFGVAVLEASASGLPVVVTDVGGLPEVVSHGETGFIHKDNDHEGVLNSLTELVKNSDFRRTMGSSGREFVLAKYSDVMCNQQMLDVYGLT